MNIRKVKNIMLIEIFICIIFFIVISFISITLNNKLDENIPLDIEFVCDNIDDQNKLDFREMLIIKNELEGYKCSGYSETDTTISTESIISKKKVKATLVDERYCDMYKVNILKGTGVDGFSVENERKVIIISDELSLQLFNSLNALEEKVKLGKDIYEVIGIYKKEKSIIYSISEDSYERVIIPYSSLGDGMKKKIDVLSIVSNDDASIVKINLGAVNKKIDNYNLVDYSTDKKIGFQNIKIIFNIIALILSIMIIYKIYKISREEYSYFTIRAKNSYFKELIKGEKKHIVMFVIKIIICLLVIFILYKVTNFELTIKNQWIPEDNILDFKFYKKVFLSEINFSNNIGTFATINERYLRNINKFQLINSILLMIQFIAFSIFSYKYKLLKNDV